ncbi:hypothetical protein CEE37_02370 [candidate division LCP-89 bacterium B3_LCP]|uniref:Peptidase M6-like domain-containing protein n=1 Tax=candidate division LCP-89 bacterium B3_LCP TaxID=2012998 RepID=A0A532V5R5_UNCL8|nr:MAG: hypothetical protein CEE37_02370 [candidate division LCP-89 bacterium B3_LCP]
MNFCARFVFCLTSLILLPTVLIAMPLHPETEQELQASGQYEQTRQAYLDAHSRGVNQPTSRPINLEMFNTLDWNELHVLTILVDFWDNPANNSIYPVNHYEELLYSEGSYPTGSLRDYILENSNDEVRIVGAVAGYYRMPNSYSYYVDNNYGWGSYPQNAQKLTEDAVAAADPDVDFSIYDNDNDGYVDAVFIVHAGSGAEQTGSADDIWSHAWVTYDVPLADGKLIHSYSMEPDDGAVGVFGHELGHALFGLPDLYDLNYDSKGTGDWSMMSSGSWGGGGNTPVHFDAWSKIQAGFINPVNISSDQSGVSIAQVETAHTVYRLWTEGNPGPQYFLVENRQKVGFDISLPGEGLLIYHIEEMFGSNSFQWYPGYTNSGHYKVAIEQADGDWDLEKNINSGDAGDPWPGNTGATDFDEISTPDSKDYDFDETSIAITNISSSASIMTADFHVGVAAATGLDLSITPQGAPVIIPANGGVITYQAELVNNDPDPVQTQFWVRAVLPSGSYYGPLMGPIDLTVPGNGNLSGTLSQVVPVRAPAGEYSLIGYVGTYSGIVEDSAAFSFEKSESGDGAGNGQNFIDWSTEGGFEAMETSQPTAYLMTQAYPNPFNPRTVISYELPDAGLIKLSVYDVAGRLITELVNGVQDAGNHEVTFDAAGLASGVYVYQLEVGDLTMTGKMILMK